MTDPVTNVEIEDVLSSIRRLVSENGRGATTHPVGRNEAKESVKRADEPSVRATQDDMLVLTPALRVPESETASAPDGGMKSSEAAGQVDTGVKHADATPEDAEDVATSNEPPRTSTLEFVVRDALDEALANMARKATGTESGRATGDDLAVNAAEAGESLKERIAELETVVAQQEGDWEPDGDSEDAYAGTPPVETLAWEDHVEEVEDSDDARDHVWSEDRLGEAEEAELVEINENDLGAAPEPVFAHAAESGADPEDVSGEAAKKDQPGPVETGLGMEASDTQRDEDDQEVDAPQDAEAMEEDVDLFGADTTVIDEEVLREMVADIVRQELQGTLGERITRNVRKLVRREIHRALAAQELD